MNDYSDRGTIMTSSKPSLALYATIALLILSCSKDPASPFASNSIIMPLAIGNQWVYHVTQYQHYTKTQIDRIDTSVVYRSTLEGTDSTYWISNLELAIWWSPSFLNRADGLYIIDHSGPKTVGGSGPPLVEHFVKYPTFPGDSIRFRYMTIRTSSVGAKVASDAGEYACVGYDAWQNDTVHLGTFWVAPNIGIVRSWQLMGADTMYVNLVSSRIH